MDHFIKKDLKEIKSRLSKLQYEVTQNNATERPFQNEYWDNIKKGIYVDIVPGNHCLAPRINLIPGAGGLVLRNLLMRV